MEKVERLKAELDSRRPLDAETEARIMQKFRLDWNYHSNNLEGNSLTYGETKALILFGITAQGKPLRDHFEITGHNEAINWILEIVKDERPLSETFIRELHTLLLKESSYKEALTPEGAPTRRKIEVGKYKTQPNHVVTVTGETFYFAKPEETPAKMQELVEWFRDEKEKSGVNPIILSALFHYRFIRIHPFDDGNGRVARILMNFILMQFGYPPAIIKTEDKENYYSVLRLADADELEPFIEYIAQNLTRSIEIMIKGAQGEDIEEPDDFDKELAFLEKKFESAGKKIEKAKTKDTVLEVIDCVLPNFIKEFLVANSKFNRFYLDSSFDLQLIQGSNISSKLMFSTLYTEKIRSISNKDIEKIIEKINPIILKLFESNNFEKFVGIGLKYSFSALNIFEVNAEFGAFVGIEFHEKYYLISNINLQESKQFLYTEKPGNTEIIKVIKAESIRHKNHLDNILTKS
ncbi:MAG TPA: Fic family protein [Pyrinomonadaceae bacterium]